VSPARPAAARLRPATGTATRCQALTVLAPLGRWGYLRTRLGLPVVGLLAPSSSLTRLRFIHFAQWSAFRSLPAERTTPRRSGLLFLADFDGDLREYLAAFGIATPHGMRWAFGGTREFPGPRPTRKLIAHVERHRRVELLRYCAYPGATVRDIDAALDVAHRLDELDGLRSLAGAHGDDQTAATTAALVETLTRTPDQVVPSVLRGALAMLRARPTVSALAVALPLRDPSSRGVAEVRRALDGWDAAFDHVGGTHFARFAILDDHLLFSAFVDGGPDDYVARLVTGLGAEADKLWRACTSYPGHKDAERLASWILTSRLPTSLFYWARSGVTVDGIRRALARRDRAMEVVTTAPHLSPVELGARLAGL
jgi:hypothetical protein